MTWQGGFSNPTVGPAQIQDGAVTSLKLADGAVVEAKLADLAVAAGKLQDEAVQNAKLGNDAVSTAKVQDLAIVQAKIGLLAVGSAQIDEVSASKLTAGTISTGTITVGSELRMASGAEIKFTRGSSAVISTNHNPQSGDRWIEYRASSAGAIIGATKSGSSEIVVAQQNITATGFEIATGDFVTNEFKWGSLGTKMSWFGGHGSGTEIIDFGQGYSLYSDASGFGSANNRLWFDTPNQGEIVLGPRSGGSSLARIRMRADLITIEGDVSLSSDTATVNQLEINNTNTRIIEGGGNAPRMQTSSGYIDVGPQNTSFGHIYTDRAKFAFNKSLYMVSGGYQHGSLPPHNNTNGSMRWLGTATDMGQAHTTSSLKHKEQVQLVDLEKSVFMRMHPIWFKYKEDHPERYRWVGKRPSAKALGGGWYQKSTGEKVQGKDALELDDDGNIVDEPVDYWQGFENPAIGRFGFAYEDLADNPDTEHWAYDANGMKAVSYEGMLPDFIGFGTAAIQELYQEVQALRERVKTLEMAA